jgi:hypothetical protein
VSIGITLRDEEFAAPENQTGGNIDNRHEARGLTQPQDIVGVSLPADASVQEPEALHFGRVEEVSPIEHDGMRHDPLGTL